MTSFEVLRRAVLAAVVHEDPMDLAGPGNDLTEEYEAEARQIARLLVHAGGAGDSAAVASAITAVFADAFGERLPLPRVARMAAALELGETSSGDENGRQGTAG